MDIQISLQKLRQKKPDAVFGVYRQHLNPYFNMMEKNSKGFLKLSKKLKVRPITRQEAPTVYQLSGLWVFDVKKFLKYKTIMVPKIIPHEIPSETGFMIDTKFELQIAEYMMQKQIIK